MNHLPAEIQASYAELLDLLIAGSVGESAGDAQGTFTRKVVKGISYWYFQHLDPGGAKRQTYLGRAEGELDRAVERLREARTGSEEARAKTRRICALLQAGGVAGIDAPSARVIRGLADAGVFRLGGVLLGTHAFITIGPMLGVRWSLAALPAKDNDSGANRVALVVPDLQDEPPSALESLRAGLLPAPPLDRKSPTTAFSVRGREMRVDLLTPAPKDGGSYPVAIPRLAATAMAVPHLDFLAEESLPAAVPEGDGILVKVPQPGRFALHKLIIASERPAIFHSSRERDFRQTAELLLFLLAERPGDIDLAVEAVKDRGRRLLGLARKGLTDLARFDPRIGKHLTL